MDEIIFNRKVESKAGGIINIIAGVLLAFIFSATGFSSMEKGNSFIAKVAFSCAIVELVLFGFIGVSRLIIRAKTEYLRVLDREIFVGRTRISKNEITKIHIPEFDENGFAKAMGKKRNKLINDNIILIEKANTKKIKIHLNLFEDTTSNRIKETQSQYLSDE